MHPAISKRTYLDPIHRDIVLDRKDPSERLVIELIDTPEFQRLRRIHQLGVSFFTFQGAEGSRFTHSVGVMHVANQLAELLGEKTPAVRQYKALILSTALLHDIGHGPYSNVTESIIGYDHEEWSCRIIAGETVVRQVLMDFDPRLPEMVVSVLRKSFFPQYISHIVSSQLDCDRFDYLLRDSYMTGTAYGLFALNRILASLEIDEEQDRIVVSSEKGQIAVEDYLFARYSMYAQVYYHKKNLAARGLLKKLLKRAKDLKEEVCFTDEPTCKWISGQPLAVNDYLELDDVQMTYHIKRWVADRDPILSDLARRFVHRHRFFHALKLPPKNNEVYSDIESRARRVVSELGLDPDYYIQLEATEIQSYDYYRPDDRKPQTSIMVRTSRGEIRELSTLSPTVKALVDGHFASQWLIYPAEARDEIARMLELMPVF